MLSDCSLNEILGRRVEGRNGGGAGGGCDCSADQGHRSIRPGLNQERELSRGIQIGGPGWEE